MPVKNGIQAYVEIKDFFRAQTENSPELVIEEPTYVLLTAFVTTKLVN